MTRGERWKRRRVTLLAHVTPGIEIIGDGPLDWEQVEGVTESNEKEPVR